MLGTGKNMDISDERENARNFLLRKREAFESLPYVKPVSLNFSNMTPDKIRELSLKEVTSSDRDNVNSGVYGSSNRSDDPCLTCNMSSFLRQEKVSQNKTCPGHNGHIDFPKDVVIYHPQHIDILVKLLNVFCKSCGELYIKNVERLSRVLGRMRPLKRIKTVFDLTSNNRICVSKDCNTKGFQYKLNKGGSKLGLIDVLCEKSSKEECTKGLPTTALVNQVRQQISDNKDRDDGGEDRAKKGQCGEGKECLYAIDARTLLQMMGPSAKVLLGFKEDEDFEWMFVRTIAVIPNISRPLEVDQNGAEKDGFLTATMRSYLKKIKDMEANKVSLGNVSNIALNNKGNQNVPKTIEDAWKTFFDMYRNITVNKEETEKNIRSTWSMIHGKKGLIRGNMLGKRGDYSARTVLGPLTDSEFWNLGIPAEFAKTQTKPIMVNRTNLRYVMDLHKKGMIRRVTKGSTGITFIMKPNAKYFFNIGDVAHRSLMEGDEIIGNRQPTLHKGSIFGASILINGCVDGEIDPTKASKNIRLPLPVTGPTNADFDGDEGNLTNPQSVSARVETRLLLDVTNNMLDDQRGSNSIGLVMNALIASYIATTPNDVITLPEEYFEQLLEKVGVLRDPAEREDFNNRLKYYGVPEYSGRALVSSVFPKDFVYSEAVNKRKVLRTGKMETVDIREGILISGQLRKKHLGTARNSIIQQLILQYPRIDPFERPVAANVITKLHRILDDFIEEYGFTVSLKDVYGIPPDKEAALKEEINKSLKDITALGSPNGDRPHDMALMARKSKALSELKKKILDAAAAGFSKDNNISIMTKKGAGAKGDEFNIAQITTALGQQYVRGGLPARRIGPLGQKRFSPYNQINDHSPESNGFIKNSYNDGLDPQELFTILLAGREGNINTAMTTGQIGDLNRAMGRTLESIIQAQNGAVVSTTGTFIAPYYNSALSAQRPHWVDYPWVSSFTFTNPTSIAEKLNASVGILPDHVAVASKIASENLSDEEEWPTEWPEYVDALPEFDLQALHNKYKGQMTSYEKARFISIRAEQLERNAKPGISTKGRTTRDGRPMVESIDIAIEEFKQGKPEFMYIVRETASKVEFVGPSGLRDIKI